VTGHHVGVGGRQNQGGAETSGRTHRAEDVGPLVTRILGECPVFRVRVLGAMLS
jgi:hypothetical protein